MDDARSRLSPHRTAQKEADQCALFRNLTSVTGGRNPGGMSSHVVVFGLAVRIRHAARIEAGLESWPTVKGPGSPARPHLFHASGSGGAGSIFTQQGVSP